MPATFARLHIAGFKSFAEPASVAILPGLTGIVGPNGCGKSNVVEALRWLMGETSARALRGHEMDDVIFAGTAHRASRNIAEVSLTLEDAAGLAPPPHDSDAELQVTRRLERGVGSTWRVNGREVRGRDVATLFADMASGARSSALISQGRVGALVGARPEDRRQILEEAAGITGLHARRHEAELKLRAAEANLSRAEDLAAQLGLQLDGLRVQARQAARYRSLSAAARDSEAAWLAVLRARAVAARDDAILAHDSAVAEQRQRQQDALDAARRDAAAGAALPALRGHEAAVRTALERSRADSGRLDLEAAQAGSALDAAQARLAQAAQDVRHARLAFAQAQADADRLSEERDCLERSAAALPARIAEATAAGEAAAQVTHAAGLAAAAADRRATEEAGTARAAEARLAEAEARAARAVEACRQLAREHDAASAGLVDPVSMAAAAACVRDAQAGLGEADQAREAAVAVHGSAAAAASHIRESRDEAGRAHRIAEAACAAALRDADRLAERHAETLAAHEAARAERPCEADLREARRGEAAAATTLAARATALDDAEAARIAAEADLAEARRQQAAAAAERTRAAAAVAEARTRLARSTEGARTVCAELAAAESACVPAADRDAARDGAEHADAAGRQAARALVDADAARAAAESALSAALSRQTGLDAAVARDAAGWHGLRESLGPDTEAGATLDAVLDVPPGLERALAAALGAALDSADASRPQAARHWRVLPPLGAAPPPPGTTPLAALLSAPPELSRALSRVFLLDAPPDLPAPDLPTRDSPTRDPAPPAVDGGALQAVLRPGEAVVSRDGALWRWDGHVVRAGTPSPAAARLSQMARLREAGLRLAAARATAAGHAGPLAEARRDARRAVAAADDARTARRTAEEQAAAAARRVADLEARDAQARARCRVLAPQGERLAAEQAEAAAALAHALHDAAAVPDSALNPAADRDVLLHAERAALDARTARTDAQAGLAAARDALSRIELREVSAAQRLLALAPQLHRLAADLADAERACREAAAARAVLPDLAELDALSLQADRSLAQATRLQDETALALQAATAGHATAAQRRDVLSARHDSAAARLDAIAPQLARLDSEATEAEVAVSLAGEALAALPDLAAVHGDIHDTGQALLHARDAEIAAQALLHALHADHRQVGMRREEIAGRADADRLAAAAVRVEELQRRLDTETSARDILALAPARLAGLAARGRDVLRDAEAGHADAALALQAAEDEARLAVGSHHAALAAAATSREAALRAEAALSQAAAALQAVADRIAERLGEAAVLPPVEAGAAGGEERARRRLDRLLAEREAMGPVNLRAEAEAEAAGARLDAIAREREELVEAVARLRGAIGSLNREGRERLAAVFQQVDRRFQALFARLFGGGRAHLALVGSDDPLLAGLEIYARPPGKTLATLSLLSGGEQALTALALIFATFGCQPAPVCVLDEVDAPLDDANVVRFCALLADIAAETATRFLVVTHHAVTMARMDRLYGVTMQERGISRLLSVDLSQAEGLAAE